MLIELARFILNGAPLGAAFDPNREYFAPKGADDHFPPAGIYEYLAPDGAKLGVSMFATTIDDLLKVNDAGEIMPVSEPRAVATGSRRFFGVGVALIRSLPLAVLTPAAPTTDTSKAAKVNADLTGPP